MQSNVGKPVTPVSVGVKRDPYQSVDNRDRRKKFSVISDSDDEITIKKMETMPKIDKETFDRLHEESRRLKFENESTARDLSSTKNQLV